MSTIINKYYVHYFNNVLWRHSQTFLLAESEEAVIEFINDYCPRANRGKPRNPEEDSLILINKGKVEFPYVVDN